MLSSLHIRNYVLIDSLEIDFPQGLVIITGQTGAGKSILLGALSLAMGGKADATSISAGADSCMVEACFTLPDEPCGARSYFEENDLDWNGGEITVRRTLNASGRSRAFVNDEPVAVPVLGGLAGYLLDIHSQHQSLKLADPKFQMSVLDAYAGNSKLLEGCRESWNRLQELERERSSVKDKLERLEADRSYNQSRFEQLDRARLREGELEELEAEQRQLTNAEQIKEGLMTVRSIEVTPSLKEAGRALEKASAFVPALADLSERLNSVRIELEDIIEEAAGIDEGISLSEERLEQVEDRMSVLYDLFKRFGCRTVEELVARREEYGGFLSDSGCLEERLETLDKAVANERSVHDGLCMQLRSSREAAAPGFSSSIEEALHSLEMDRAAFRVAVSPKAPSSDGADAVSFTFSSSGTGLKDVSKCASGGEMSRIMLCLKALMARFANMPTMIFDEIDTGVSGSTADRMGRMICEMGGNMQIFSITHLPQVAAMGKAHFLVSKEEVKGSASVRSSIRRISGEERLYEIARMLSGSSVSEEALANARVLLGDNSVV